MRKHISVKIISILSAFVMAIFMFAGCADKGNGEGGSTSSNPFTTTTRGDVEGGTHIYNVGTTNEDFITNGKTEYVVVLPDDADYYEQTAFNEFSTFISEATGAVFESVRDSELTGEQIAGDGKYISIGDTEIFRAENITLDKSEFGDGGFIIKTVGKKIILTGATQYSTGTLYAAYELLHQLINFEVYTADVITYDTVSTIKLPDFDIKDIPDFPWRVVNTGMTCSDTTTASRMRMNYNRSPGSSTFQMTLGGATHHTMQHLIPAADYRESNSEWFAKNAPESGEIQHCYTCRGDELQFKLFVGTTVEKLKAETIAQPNAKFANLGQADMPYWCNCDECTEVRETYGANSAAVILWMNEVSEQYYAWLNEEYPERDVTLSIFAYHDTTEAPAVKDANGEYQAVNGLHLENGVTVMYAPIEANRIDSMYYDDTNLLDNNSRYTEILKGWQAVADSISLWIYGTNYATDAWITPFNAFNAIQDNYKFAKENNIYWFQYQRRNSSSDKNGVGFMNLAAYLDSKFGWNVNADYNTLVNNYFNAVYGPAAQTMLGYFNALRAQFAVIESNSSFSRMGETNYVEAEYWPELLLKQYIAMCDKALAEIEPLRESGDAMYDIYKEQIVLESIGPRFMLIEFYGLNYHQSELLEMKTEFKSDIIDVGITQTAEISTATVGALYEKWGV